MKRELLKEFREEMMAGLVAGDQCKICFGKIYILVYIYIYIYNIYIFAKLNILQNFLLYINKEDKGKENVRGDFWNSGVKEWHCHVLRWGR